MPGTHPTRSFSETQGGEVRRAHSNSHLSSRTPGGHLEVGQGVVVAGTVLESPRRAGTPTPTSVVG